MSAPSLPPYLILPPVCLSVCGRKGVLYKGIAYQLCLLAGLFSSVGRVSAYKAKSRGFESRRSPLFLPLCFHHSYDTAVSFSPSYTNQAGLGLVATLSIEGLSCVCLSVCLSVSLSRSLTPSLPLSLPLSLPPLSVSSFPGATTPRLAATCSWFPRTQRRWYSAWMERWPPTSLSVPET